MKKSIIISLMAFFSFTIGNAGNVQIQNVSMEPGKTVDVNISLSSAANQYIGVQFDFTLPEGFSLENGDNGNVFILSSNQADDMVCNVQAYENGTSRFVLYSNTLQSLKAGELLSVHLKASSSLSLGDYTITIGGIAFSDVNGVVTKESEVNATVTIFDPSSDVVVITAKSYSREYGEANPAFEYTVTGEALDGTPEITCEATPTSPAGKYPIVISKGSVTNSNVTFVNGTLTITKAPLLISAGTYTKRQYEPMPEFTLTYTGFKNNETSAVLTKQVIVKCDATEDSAPGEYPITLSGAEAQNYEISYVAGTLTINEPQSYTLTYLVDGEVYKTSSIKYRSTITPEPAPTKDGYTFSGWSEIPKTMPAHDVTVTGSFTINKYKLTYKVDGEVYKTYDVEYGTKITPEPAPTKEGYSFSGWSEIPETMPAHDVTVTGTFKKGAYKLIYMVDGETYKTINYDYGDVITPEPAPTREGYTFSGWSDIPETMPAHDVTVTGSFTINKYKLTYVVDGEEYKSYNVEYGAKITPEPAPTKEGYTFSGWSDIPETMPAHDVTVTGTFTIDAIVVDGVTFEETGDGVVLADGGNLSGDVTIPSVITSDDGQTYSVTGIGEGAFKGNTNITSITISEGITQIGAEAFEGCTNLKEIIIGRDVTAIADKAFADIVPSASAPRRADGVVLTVSCYAVNVPQTAENAFENTPIDNALLLVNDDIINDYCNAEPWKSFGTIQGFNGGSGINTIWADGGNAKIYTLDGKQLDKPQKGINIVRMSDGTVKKIVVSW